MQLRHRRICRRPEPVVLSEPATAAAAASRLLGSAAEEQPGNAAAVETVDMGANAAYFPLSGQAVEHILLERYSTKYNRLGVPEKMPGRERWLKQQHAAREAAKAAAALAAAAAAADTAAARLLSRTGGTTMMTSGAAGSGTAGAAAVMSTVESMKQ